MVETTERLNDQLEFQYALSYLALTEYELGHLTGARDPGRLASLADVTERRSGGGGERHAIAIDVGLVEHLTDRERSVLRLLPSAIRAVCGELYVSPTR